MSAAKRPFSSSPSPGPETKKHRTDDTDTMAGLGAGYPQDEIEWAQEINEDYYSPSASQATSQIQQQDNSHDTATATGRADANGPTSTAAPKVQGTSEKGTISGMYIALFSPAVGSGRSCYLDTDRLTARCATGTTVDVLSRQHIAYRILLGIRSSDGNIKDDPDEGSVRIYHSKPLFWDDKDDKRFTKYQSQDRKDGYNAKTPASPITPLSASPPPNPVTVPTLQQLQQLTSQLAGAPSDSQSGSTSTASSSSRFPSTTPPSVPTTAYLHLKWGRYEALGVCELLGRDNDPKNFRPMRISWSLAKALDFMEIYFESREEGAEAVVDDNGNRFMVVDFLWKEGIEHGDKMYAKRVVNGYWSTELSAAERKRIVRPELKRLGKYFSEEEDDQDEEDKGDDDESQDVENH